MQQYIWYEKLVNNVPKTKLLRYKSGVFLFSDIFVFHKHSAEMSDTKYYQANI